MLDSVSIEISIHNKHVQKYNNNTRLMAIFQDNLVKPVQADRGGGDN